MGKKEEGEHEQNYFCSNLETPVKKKKSLQEAFQSRSRSRLTKSKRKFPTPINTTKSSLPRHSHGSSLTKKRGASHSSVEPKLKKSCLPRYSIEPQSLKNKHKMNTKKVVNRRHSMLPPP